MYQLPILRKPYGSMTSLTGAWEAYRSKGSLPELGKVPEYRTQTGVTDVQG